MVGDMVGLDPQEKAAVLKGSQERSSVVGSAGVSKDHGAGEGGGHLSVTVSIWGRS